MGKSEYLRETYHIVEESSTVAYDDYREQKKRSTSSAKSTASSESSAPAFKYIPQREVPVQPQYICYPSGGVWPQQRYCQPAYAAQPPFTAQFHPSVPYHQYQCYPNGNYSTQLPTMMAPVPQAATGAKQITTGFNEEHETAPNIWIGRTRAQVDEDNVRIALRENVWKYDPMKPDDAKDDQLFWVVETDGRTTLRTYKTIEDDLGPGKWDRDPRFGNAFFTREPTTRDE